MIPGSPEPVDETAEPAIAREAVERCLRLLDRSIGGPSAAVLRRGGDDVWLGSPDDELHRALGRTLGTGGAICGDGAPGDVRSVALLAADGEVLGALAATIDPDDPGEAAALGDAAALLRDRLDELEARRRLRVQISARAESEQITALSRAMLGSVTVEEVVRNAVDHLGRIDLGNVVSIGIPDTSEAVLRLRHGGARSGYLASRWPELPVDASFPMAVAFRTGALVDVTDDGMSAYPELADELDRLGAATYAAVSLRGTDDEIVGSLGIAARSDQRIDRALLVRVASIIGDAVERTDLLERSSTTARLLSTAIMPSRIDPVPGIEIGASFALASDRAWVGGDWYDVLAGDQRTGLVIGDVAGHDVGAARTAARLRFALAALFDERPDDPAYVIERVHQHAKRSRTRRAATILLAVIEQSTGRVEVVSAGHPPPVVVRGGGATFVELAPAPPVGTLDGTGRPGHVRLDRGDRLVLFSDGIVERRDESIDLGLDRLLMRVAGHEGSVASLARSLADTTSGDDDASTLVVERTRQ